MVRKTALLPLVLPMLLAAVGGSVFLYKESKTPAASIESTSQEGPVQVLTYSSFYSHFGPAHRLKKIFESTSTCQVEFESVGDAGLLLPQLKNKNDVDVVVGLDQLYLAQALRMFEWRSVNWDADAVIDVAQNVGLPPFVPYDWSPLAVLSRTGGSDNDTNSSWSKLKDFTEAPADQPMTVPHPKYSSTGAQFLYWVEQAGQNQRSKDSFPEKVKFFADWTQSFALFQHQKASSTFTQLSSLAFHREQGQLDVGRVDIKEPHPYQVEFSGLLKKCKNCACGEKFIVFLHSPQAQMILQKNNYMFPVVKDIEQPEFFQGIAMPPLIKYPSAERLGAFLNGVNGRW